MGESPSIIEKIELEDLFNSERRKQEIADLEAKSKELYELVVTEHFTVDEVVAKSYATSIATRIVVGGQSSYSRGGYISKIVMQVTPDNQDIPVRTLNFNGASTVRAGDRISARIPRYKEEKAGMRFIPGPKISRSFYFDRDFNPNEDAIELNILSEDGISLRKERSVDYGRFVKKES